MTRICKAQGCERVAPYIDYCRKHKSQIYKYGKLRPDLDIDRRTFSRIKGAVAYVPISRGFEVLVDAADLGLVNRYKWTADVRKKKSSTSVYAFRTNEEKTTEYLHRYIMGAKDSDLTVDHINGNTLDNRRSNLRVVSYSSNCQNRPKILGCASQYIGVSFLRNKWRSRIRFNCKEFHLGTFDNEEDAAIYYDLAAQFLYGVDAKVNGV